MGRHRNDRDGKLDDRSDSGGPVISQLPSSRELPDDRIDDEPPGFTDVAMMATSIGAAASGYLRASEANPNDLEQARLRLHDIQVALVALGYDVSGRGRGGGGDGIDGVWGPATRNAIAEFQDEHDMPRSGQLDSDTYQAILAAHESAVEAVATDDDIFEGDQWSSVRSARTRREEN
ncbi:MAG: peptidoglycan-binding protein [Myxococcota bacterium]|nr:peptidoglycan-binding domain-containing protein [Myxococcota bacterium]